MYSSPKQAVLYRASRKLHLLTALAFHSVVATSNVLSIASHSYDLFIRCFMWTFESCRDLGKHTRVLLGQMYQPSYDVGEHVRMEEPANCIPWHIEMVLS
jgi:hypothetical protein